MCDKESSSHLVMSEIFDSLIMYTGTLYGTYNKAWGGWGYTYIHVLWH